MNVQKYIRQAAVPVLAVVLVGASVAARQVTAGGNAEFAKLKNPVASTPESIAAGQKAYMANCSACHGNTAEGAEKAGITVSAIEDIGGKQPPALNDDTWDYGSTDGEIFMVIKSGVSPFFMTPFNGRLPDNDIWSVVNYLRSLSKK
jgi:mono/diheme cytochrome c family protein